MKNGFTFIDKPEGLTSHDVVAQVRRLLATKKVGHAGTLDPFATGLLILGVNKATRLLTFLVGLDKSYSATVRLGESRDTDDKEGAITATSSVSHLEEGQIRDVVASFRGQQMQIPSTYSAKKISGQTAYSLARRGESVELAAKQIEIKELSILQISIVDEFIDIGIELTCSSGTYVRALARDIGNVLGVGAHLTKLRRLSVGSFSVNEARNIESLEIHSMKDICSKVMPISDVTADQVQAIRHGKPLQLDVPNGVRALVNADDVIAIIDAVEGKVHYKVVLAE
ncbi:MAG: tRNA pseudouridine synthase [Actinomycetota bacterium]|jgi:tRNA pseudouridine55 synthase